MTTNKPNRVLCGGGWNDGDYSARCADRGDSIPGGAYYDYGFRAVLKPTNQPTNINMKNSSRIQFKSVTGIDTLFAETPMTEGQWSFYSGGTCAPDREDYPKVDISWDDCQAMLVKMNALSEDEGGPPDGYEFDFPAEAEWEIACRGGSPTEVIATPETAHYNARALAPVKTKEPNAFGLYDMLGNVWEWCKDEYYPS